MKLERPFKKKISDEDDDSSMYRDREKSEPEKSSSIADWACTDSSKFKKLSKEAKIEGRRAPEVWVPEGQKRLVRFIEDEPIVSFKVYKMKHNGKWRMFVKPADGMTDLFATAMGLRATRVFLFRVVDINGYKDKQGKEHRNQPRFLVASSKVFDNIQMMAEENSDAGSLSEYNVSISRMGSGTSTTYQYMPKPPTPMTPEMKKAAANFPRFTDFYKPASRSQQEAIAVSHGKSVDEDEDDE